MQNLTDNNAERQSREHFLEILVISLLLTVIFHFFPAKGPFGLAFFIFSICLASGITYIARLNGSIKNRWAYLFLIPVGLTAVADLLYASEVVRRLSLLITFISLSFYAYWSCNISVHFKQITSFWPFKFFKETFWPFGSLPKALARFKSDHRLGSVLIGLVIAIPFMLLFFAIFSSADMAFAGYFNNLFSGGKFGEYSAKLIRDIFVGTFFFASGAAMLIRKISEDTHVPKDSHSNPLSQTVYVTFLGLLNLLFLVFVCFQLVYFFGGQHFVLANGLTYADYARHGFFELLFGSGVVFVIVWAIYYLSNMKQVWTKVLTITLIVQTGIIIVSALRRLILYVSVYNLTLQRWWAAFCIILIALVLLLVVIACLKQFTYNLTSKIIFLFILIFSSAALLVNTEAIIARYNIQRYLSGQSRVFDPVYLNHDLSSDAVPEVAKLLQVSWPKIETEYGAVDWEQYRESYRKGYITRFDSLNEKLIHNWQSMSLSELRAISVINSIK